MEVTRKQNVWLVRAPLVTALAFASNAHNTKRNIYRNTTVKSRKRIVVSCERVTREQMACICLMRNKDVAPPCRQLPSTAVVSGSLPTP